MSSAQMGGAAAPVEQQERASNLDAIVAHTMSVNALNPIVGDYDQRTRAFKDYSSNVAQSGLGINGWDSTPKLMTGCWLADAIQVHPAVFMQGNYLMNIQGKNIVEPKWEFIVGLLEARLPGFSWEIEVEENERAVVSMSNGRNSHRVEYTIEDAKRQGLWEKKGGTYPTNSREMLLKQAVKRCARRVGSHILMGLPDRDDENATMIAQPPVAQGAAATLAAALPLEPVNEVKRVASILERLFLLKPKDLAGKLAKASMVMTQIRGSKVEYLKADHLSPSDAKEIADFLEAKYPNGVVAESGGGAPTGAVTEAASAAPVSEPAQVAAREPGDEEPPPVGEPVEDPEREAEARTAQYEFEQDGKIATLVLLDDAAKKAFHPRAFLKESPAGSKKFWFIDEAILMERGSVYESGHAMEGQAKAIKVLDNGAQAIDADACRWLCKMVRSAGVAVTGAALPRHANRSGAGR